MDIGFGDVVTPDAREIDFPTMLEFPAPRLRAYPPETVMAEKFQALVALGMLNSRMKDFYDLWAIAITFRFEGAVLAEAIRATFERRATDVPAEEPIALTRAFADDPLKQSQWQGFLRRTAAFVMPPSQSLTSTMPFDSWWPPAGPWMAGQSRAVPPSVTPP